MPEKTQKTYANVPSERYAALVQQLGEEIGFTHGWKAKVADLLGVDPTYVAKIHSGERTSVSRAIIDRACERQELDPAFFSDESGHYRDHRLRASAAESLWNETLRPIGARVFDDAANDWVAHVVVAEPDETETDPVVFAHFLLEESRMAALARGALGQTNEDPLYCQLALRLYARVIGMGILRLRQVEREIAQREALKKAREREAKKSGHPTKKKTPRS